MTHFRYMTHSLSSSKIRIHPKKRREQNKHSCRFHCIFSKHLRRFRCVLNNPSILLNPNPPSTSQFLNSMRAWSIRRSVHHSEPWLPQLALRSFFSTLVFP